jgi:DHA1 family multidrug resistance protein-like MFS transporter
MGAAMPIVARPLFNNLGIAWGNSVFAFLAVAFIPLPFLLMWYGPWLRSKSPRATHFVEESPSRRSSLPDNEV